MSTKEEKKEKYRKALADGTPLAYPYGDPQDPEWFDVRAEVRDETGSKSE